MGRRGIFESKGSSWEGMVKLDLGFFLLGNCGVGGLEGFFKDIYIGYLLYSGN